MGASELAAEGESDWTCLAGSNLGARRQAQRSVFRSNQNRCLWKLPSKEFGGGPFLVVHPLHLMFQDRQPLNMEVPLSYPGSPCLHNLAFGTCEPQYFVGAALKAL